MRALIILVILCLLSCNSNINRHLNENKINRFDKDLYIIIHHTNEIIALPCFDDPTMDYSTNTKDFIFAFYLCKRHDDNNVFAFTYDDCKFIALNSSNESNKIMAYWMAKQIKNEIRKYKKKGGGL